MNKNSYHWYSLLVRRGKETKVLEKITQKLENSPWKEHVSKLEIVKNGQKKILKGFVFCYANLNLELVKIFYEIPEVIKFLGHSGESEKLPNFIPEEIKKTYFETISESKKVANNYSMNADLKIGDSVKIISGLSSNFEGWIVKITPQNVSIEVELGGKKTLLENIPINSVRKILN